MSTNNPGLRATVEREPFLKALTHLSRIVERRNTIPILGNVLLASSPDGGIALRVTDLDIEATERIPAEIIKDGATTVKASLLFDLMKKVPDGAQVSLTSGNGREVDVEAGRTRFSLLALPASDFPELSFSTSGGERQFSFEMSVADLKEVLGSTAFAISTEETRYYLNGVYFHPSIPDKKMIRAVATDGHRLAMADVAMPEGAEGFPGVIIPRKTVNEVLRLIDKVTDPIKIELSASRIRLIIGTVTLTSKLIDGTFPDYIRVIPKANTRSLTVDRAALSSAVERVATIANERGRAVKMQMEPSADVVRVSVNNPDSGQASDEVTASFTSPGGMGLDIGFNSKYLIDMLHQGRTPNVVMQLEDPGSPTLVFDEGNETRRFVLMPMRV